MFLKLIKLKIVLLSDQRHLPCLFTNSLRQHVPKTRGQPYDPQFPCPWNSREILITPFVRIARTSLESLHKLFNSCQKHLWEIKSLCSKEVHHRNGWSCTFKNFGCILSKQTTPEIFQKFTYSCWALEALCCCMFGSRIHWRQVPF